MAAVHITTWQYSIGQGGTVNVVRYVGNQVSLLGNIRHGSTWRMLDRSNGGTLMHAVILPVEGDPILCHFEENSCYDMLRDAVHGYIERVRLTPNVDMWVNEEYRITSPAPPINKVATHLYQVHRGGDYILGDVIFTGPCGPEGETLGLPDMAVTTLMNIKKIDAAENN